jgi:hypothetical protein
MFGREKILVSPIGLPNIGNNFNKIVDSLLELTPLSSSLHLGLLNLVSMSPSSKYLEQNVRHSSTMYPSAIQPSGAALLRTYDFKCPRLLQNKKE